MSSDRLDLALPRLIVVGSINLDLTAVTERLPRPGETVGGSKLHRGSGGKGANQAVAAARLGSRTRMVGAVGDDADGRAMIDALRAAGVDTEYVVVSAEATGTALIVVDHEGENQIAVCPGANADVRADQVPFADDDVVLAQLEIPVAAVTALAELCPGYLAVNAAPAQELPSALIERADLIIVNESEYALLPALVEAPLVAVTYGAAGAALLARGTEVVRVPGQRATVVNTVGAGDAFCAALVLGLAGGLDQEEALRTACAVGAAAVADPESQPALEPFHTYR